MSGKEAQIQVEEQPKQAQQHSEAMQEQPKGAETKVEKPGRDEASMREIASRIKDSDIRAKVEKFLSLPESERRARIDKFITYVIQIYKSKGNPVEAGIEIMQLLATNSTALIYLMYMFKPKFREDVLALLLATAEAIERLSQP